MLPSISLLFSGLLPSLLATDVLPTPKEDAESVEAVRKAAETAEVHGIGISEPVAIHFLPKDVTNWPEFVALLRRKEGPAGRVWELLPKEVQDIVADDKVVAELGDRSSSAASRLRTSTTRGIRKLLDRPDFYTERAFKDAPLDKNLDELLALGEKRTHLQTLRMNRQLLATAFPNLISPVPANYHAVPVLVKAGKPVVLVLTSYRICQWHIEVEKGGEVAGIILGGTEPQEVAGVKAPLVYRVAYAPDGKTRKGDMIRTCYDRQNISFTQLVAGVKKITDKTFTKFQGLTETPKEGFVVKPGAK